MNSKQQIEMAVEAARELDLLKVSVIPAQDNDDLLLRFETPQGEKREVKVVNKPGLSSVESLKTEISRLITEKYSSD